MGPKKRQEKIARGWLPNEPANISYFNAQASRQPKIKSFIGYTCIFVGVFVAVFLTMSTAYGVGLGSSQATFTVATAVSIATIIVSLMLLKPNQKPNPNKPLTENGKKAAKTIGIANLVMAGVFLGTYFLVNPLPSVEATLGLWIVLLSTMFLVNNLLYRQFKKIFQHD